MTRLVPLLLLAAGVSAMEIGVDPACAWYAPTGSHHHLHAAGGAVIGAASYALLRTFETERAPAFWAAVGATFLAASAWEVIESQHERGALADPVDVGWTTAGGALGAGAACGIDFVISGYATPDRAAVSVAWRF